MSALSRRAVTASAAAFVLTLAVAGTAAADTYYISPYLQGNQDAYTLSGCTMFTTGWGSAHTLHAYEGYGDCSGKIGIRVVDVNGDSSSIVFRDAHTEADAPYGYITKYKLYHY